MKQFIKFTKQNKKRIDIIRVDMIERIEVTPQNDDGLDIMVRLTDGTVEKYPDLYFNMTSVHLIFEEDEE